MRNPDSPERAGSCPAHFEELARAHVAQAIFKVVAILFTAAAIALAAMVVIARPGPVRYYLPEAR